MCVYVFVARIFLVHYSDAASLESTHTLTNETFNESNDACEMSDVITAPNRMKRNNKQQQETELNGDCSNEALSEQLTTSPSTISSRSPENGDIDAKDDGDGDDDDGDGKNAGKNLARYKRRNSNSDNSISLPRTPLDTPLPRRREYTKRLVRAAANAAGATTKQNSNTSTDKDTFVQVKNAKTTVKTNCNGNNKDSGSAEDVAIETKSVNGGGGSGGGVSARKRRAKYLNMVGSRSSSKVFEHDSERDSDSLASINKQRAASSSNKSDAMRRLSVSNATLRNVNVPLFLASCRLLLAFPIHSFALIFMQIFNDKNRNS